MTLSKRVLASGKMSTVDVAREMGVKRSTAWLWIKNGALKAERIGNFLVVDRTVFDAFRSKYRTSSSEPVSPTSASATKNKSSAKGKSKRGQKGKKS